jgi:hypothetical protein
VQRIAAALRAPLVLLARPLNGAAVVLDDTDTGALRLRRAIAALLLLFGVLVVGRALTAGELPSFAELLIVMLAVALFLNRGGRFVRDWLPVFGGGLAYVVSAGVAHKFALSVHYTPQIEAERALFGGGLPTVWLQTHLYDGATGFLEVASAIVYVSHFIAPIVLAFLMWTFWSRRGFAQLFFGLLLVTVLGEITFVLAPTAPPWLAAQEGLIPPVHDVIKQALFDLGMTPIAEEFHSSSYNTVAAIPSLHVAWPLIALFVVLDQGLPRWVAAFQASFLVAVVLAIVYTGEHYVVDALVGAVYAVVAWLIVRRVLGTPAQADGR